MLLRALIILIFASAAGGIHASITQIELPSVGRERKASIANDPFALSLEETIKKFAEPDVVFVDASSAREFREAHIPGAIHIPLTDFAGGSVPESLDYFSQEATVVVYCPTDQCDAALRVAEFLRAFGHKQVFVFHEGLAAWRQAGQPCEP